MFKKIKNIFCALFCLMLVFCLFASVSFAASGTDNSRQIILIKLDDMREGAAVRNAFKRVQEYIDQKGIKASFGVIGISLEDNGKKDDYYEDIKSFAADENIEIWHHGYYHNSSQYTEFNGGTYEEQYSQLHKTIDLLKEKCSVTVKTFGSPYNATDETTVKVLNDTPQIKCVFYPSVSEGANALMLKNDGKLETSVGVIDYEAFIENYEKNSADKPYLVLQGHPGGWGDESFENFKKIVDFLESKNVEFMTPIQYYNRLNSNSSIHPESLKYNKSLMSSKDIELKAVFNGNVLSSVLCGDKILSLEKDYTTSGDTITIKEEFIRSLEKGICDIIFSFSSGDDAAFSLMLIDPENEPIKVIIDDEIITFDVEPIIINDRTMVPFRAIFEKSGAAVSWDEYSNTASGTLDETTISLPIDSKTAYVNDKPIELDVAATVVGDRTLVPLRFISENFGAKVSWNDETRTAKIDSCPVNTTLAEGDFKGKGLKVIKTKSVLKDYKSELFTMDGQIIPDDRWAAEGNYVWIQYELDDIYNIDSAAIAWFKGGERKSKFEIQISEDGKEYTKALDAETAGLTDQMEKYEFAPIRGKYVRVYCKGNNSASSTLWNSLLEVEIYGNK